MNTFAYFHGIRAFFKLIKYSSQYMNPKIHYLLTRCDSAQLLGARVGKKWNLNWKTVKREKSDRHDLWNGTELFLFYIFGKRSSRYENFFYITPHNLFVTYEAILFIQTLGFFAELVAKTERYESEWDLCGFYCADESFLNFFFFKKFINILLAAFSTHIEFAMKLVMKILW